MNPSDAVVDAPATVVAELRHVQMAYGPQPVLRDVSLAVPAGAVLGLVGPNGSGKSTLLRCLLGLAEPQQGSASLFGADALDPGDAVRARLGFVPQSPQLVEWMTVQQHLDYIGGFYPRWQRDRLAQWAQQWGVDTTGVVGRLSPGGKQKLALLLALGHGPELVVLDEPVASLDPLMRREFMRTLFEPDERRTVIVSSHLLTDLQRVVSHVAFLREGRVVLFDEWDALVESVRRVEGVAALPAGPGVLVNPAYKGHGLVDLRRLAPGALPTSARLAPLNLDDLFVELMS